MKKVIFFLFFITSTSSFSAPQNWMHRFQEKRAKSFEYKEQCKNASREEIENLFNFHDIRPNFEGIEVDTFYRKDIDKLVIFHGNKLASDGNSYYQCFSGYYVSLELLIDIIQSKYPQLNIWIDLKNKSLSQIIKSMEKLKKIDLRDNIIVETKSYFGAFLSLKNKINTLVWVKFDKPIDTSFAGRFRGLKNEIKLLMLELIGAPNISSPCSDLSRNLKLLRNKEFKLYCWGKSSSEIESKLQVILR